MVLKLKDQNHGLLHWLIVNMINKIKFLYTYDKMFEDLDKINKSLILDNWKPDIIFGIPRGGLIPAVHLSHSLNAKLEINNTRLNNYLHKQKNILIVDDIWVVN